MQDKNQSQVQSFIDPYNTSGEFFRLSKGAQDAHFKVQELQHVLQTYMKRHPHVCLKQVVDVGCGSGDTTLLLSNMLRGVNKDVHVSGYDIHPAMEELSGNRHVSFHYADFTQTNMEIVDLVVLFDVIEHVPNPISFLQLVSHRSRLVALHIPLDDSWLLGIRNLWKRNLVHPGHLVVLNIPSAINLLTFAGLRIIDYSLTPVFRAPSGKTTRSQRIVNPIRSLLYFINPFILQKTLGGVSLMVLTATIHAYEK